MIKILYFFFTVYPMQGCLGQACNKLVLDEPYIIQVIIIDQWVVVDVQTNAMMFGTRPDSKTCASGACLDLNSQIGKHTPDKWSCGIFDLGDSLQTFAV